MAVTMEDKLKSDHYFKKTPISRAIKMRIAATFRCPIGVNGPAWCAYCGERGSIDWERGRKICTTNVRFRKLELDHVIPEFLGGSNDFENIVLACRKCNRSRGHKGKYQPAILFPPPAPEAQHG